MDVGAELRKPWPRFCFINRLIEAPRASFITASRRPVQAVRSARMQGHKMQRNNGTCQQPAPFSPSSSKPLFFTQTAGFVLSVGELKKQRGAGEGKLQQHPVSSKASTRALLKYQAPNNPPRSSAICVRKPGPLPQHNIT